MSHSSVEKANTEVPVSIVGTAFLVAMAMFNFIDDCGDGLDSGESGHSSSH